MSKKGEEKFQKQRMKVMENARKASMKKKRGGTTKSGEKIGLIKRTTNFLTDVYRELKKVSWPGRAETISSTWVVLVVIFIFGFYFGIVDYIMGFLVNFLLSGFNLDMIVS